MLKHTIFRCTTIMNCGNSPSSKSHKQSVDDDALGVRESPGERRLISAWDIPRYSFGAGRTSLLCFSFFRNGSFDLNFLGDLFSGIELEYDEFPPRTAGSGCLGISWVGGCDIVGPDLCIDGDWTGTGTGVGGRVTSYAKIQPPLLPRSFCVSCGND